MHKTVCCEGGMLLSDIGTNNIRGNEFNPTKGCDMVRLDHLYNTCQIEVTGYKISEQCILYELTWLSWGLNSMSLKCPYDFRMMNLSLE